MKMTANKMDCVISLWLHDHPGGTVEDFERARAPFNAEPGRRHRRVLSWLNTERVQRAIFDASEAE